MGDRAGMIPLDVTSDVGGPITRTVEDTARLLAVLQGADPADALTLSAGRPPDNYTQFLQSDGLQVRARLFLGTLATRTLPLRQGLCPPLPLPTSPLPSPPLSTSPNNPPGASSRRSSPCLLHPCPPRASPGPCHPLAEPRPCPPFFLSAQPLLSLCLPHTCPPPRG